MFRGLKNITRHKRRPLRYSFYEGTEESTGVSWWISRHYDGRWAARRDNYHAPTLFGRTLAELNSQLERQ